MKTPRFMLDTNILSAVIKRPQSPLAERILEADPDSLCTSIIVSAELRFGAQRRGSDALTAKVEALLEEIEVLPLGAEADRHYARVRTTLERQGTPIGSNDLLIAAHALALDCTLVTDNLREFSRVPGLRTENWLA